MTAVEERPRMHAAHVERRAAFDVRGSGAHRRDFIFVGDLADACVFAVEPA
jgi:nucleoside-diphosphate-sugar epimerase